MGAAPASAAEVLTNGDFQLGLTGWTAYTTVNGTIAELPSMPGAPAPQDASVVSFDVTGGGASDALFLNAGRIEGFGAPGAGGGVFQTFTTTGGLATFYADIAALYTRTSGASDLGLLSVILDGVVMDSHAFGGVGSGPATLRDALGFTADLAAGQHTIALQATRNFAPARGVFSQYFDNASLDVAAVPEPSTWAMMLLGFGLAGGVVRRRRRLTASFAA
ncbi:PEPxxWA-CTERM sorting domain-containing protein [Phenylobacterium sp.]|uniref:PEPxxWA-CTERM sorting domain-containing protein n=1 Tax=Phenylobacterium sp. TaxID=1871053 RepID=UPI0025F10CEE|nr:PEPxxWA-CTERM sorting domain-containing protein [Phenylobacterium sp.]